MPKVSIVIPVYKVEKYINKCLDSLLEQTFKDFEIILVDDGSPDNSGSICEEYAKNYSFIQVIHQENSGAGKARNAGIELAKGKYVTFTDADDWVAPEMLEKAIEVLDNGFDLVMFGNQAVWFNKKETKVVKTQNWGKSELFSTKKECRENFLNLLESTSLNTPWNKLYKMEIINEHNIRFPDVRRGQDAFFNMEYYKHINSFYLTAEVLYYFRQNTKEKIWKKFPKDLYLIDVYYDKFLVDMFNDWKMYEGRNKNQIDTLCVNSVYRTINFNKNPLWKLNKAQKLEYVENIVKHPYYVKRLNEIEFMVGDMEAKRKVLLSNDYNKILKKVSRNARKNAFYDGKLYGLLSGLKNHLIGK